MTPNLSELLFASRYTLPFWVVGGLWVWFSGQAEFHWQRFDETGRVSMIFFLCAMVAGVAKAFPKVWAYEQAKRDYAAATRDPEDVKRRRRFVFWLLACASWGGSLWWVTQKTYAANPDLYLAALGIAVGGSLWVLVAIYSRLPVSLKNRLCRSSPGREEKAFIVRGTLPIPKHAPNRKQIHAGLPDYCKLVLTT